MKGVVGGIGQLGGALAALDPMAPARDIMQLTQDMRRNSGMNKELAQNIGTTTDQLRIFGVDAQEAAAATKALYADADPEYLIYEASYSYPVNDGMTITPGVFVKEGTSDETGVAVKASFAF